jgi:hypothetical protein
MFLLTRDNNSRGIENGTNSSYYSSSYLGWSASNLGTQHELGLRAKWPARDSSDHYTHTDASGAIIDLQLALPTKG